MRKFNSRILAIYATILILFFVFKSLTVPATFGELGWYRGDSVRESINLSQKFADTYQCFDCHVDEYALWSVGEHRGVECESCHGALKAHVLDPVNYRGVDEYLSSTAYSSTRDFCMSCHVKSTSKPESFPQITDEMGWNCLQCHDPHNPIEGEW
jgi:hypothetical protein